MSKGGSRLSRLGVLAPVALSACIDASVLAAPAAGAIVSTVLNELSKAFMLKKWYHGAMTAKEAEVLLLQRGKSGSYLVRESQTSPGEYVLSVRVRGRVRHVKIRTEQNKYNIGTGEIFDDLSGLIEHCRAFPLTETSGEVLRLRQPVSEAQGRHRTAQVKKPLEQVSKPKVENKIKAMGSQPPHQFAQGEGDLYFGGDNPAYQPDIDENAVWNDDFSRIGEIEAKVWFTKIEGLKPENEYKNRHKSIVPYDQTRVRIPQNIFSLEDTYTDYLNASYVRPKYLFEPIKKALARTYHVPDSPHDPHNINILEGFVNEEAPIACEANLIDLTEGSVGPSIAIPVDPVVERHKRQIYAHMVPDKFYIAAQGNLPFTRKSFWAAVACNDVRIITTLTQEKDHDTDKCDRFWPNIFCHEWHGDLKVSNIDEVTYEDYKIRFFEIFNRTTEKRTTVYQFQYLRWQDHGIPEDIHSILYFIKEINNLQIAITQEEGAPKDNILWVHCSAGVGRTGTFIALDMLIDSIKYQSCHCRDVNADVFSVLKLLRWQRPGMVQNRLQYGFIYDVLSIYMQHYYT